jgi:hypothetical protein
MSYEEQAKSKGSLFVEEDKEGKQPDFKGYVEVTREQIDKLIEMTKLEDTDCKLQIAAWKKTSQAGTRYLFLSTEAYVKEDKGEDGWKETNKEDGWGDSAPPLTDPPAAPAGDGFEDDDIPF